MNGDGVGSAAPYVCNGTDRGDSGNGIPIQLNPALAEIGGGAFAQRHLDGIDFSFVDGHVKWYRANTPEQLSRVYNRNTPFNGGTLSLGQNPTFRVTE